MSARSLSRAAAPPAARAGSESGAHNETNIHGGMSHLRLLKGGRGGQAGQGRGLEELPAAPSRGPALRLEPHLNEQAEEWHAHILAQASAPVAMQATGLARTRTKRRSPCLRAFEAGQHAQCQRHRRITPHAAQSKQRPTASTWRARLSPVRLSTMLLIHTRCQACKIDDVDTVTRDSEGPHT